MRRSILVCAHVSCAFNFLGGEKFDAEEAAGNRPGESSDDVRPLKATWRDFQTPPHALRQFPGISLCPGIHCRVI